jgi:exodeoxyribonuclease VII large subunit
MQDIPLSPSEFVALFNQTLEAAWPVVVIEGELSDFRVAKNKWVYFDLKDEEASVRFFGSVYNLPGPLTDGLTVKVVGAPRLHPRFGFTINVQSIVPTGEGSLRKVAELLRRKLEAEGLFAPERKRPLPAIPETVGLITAQASAAYSDFIKILGERWGGLEIQLIDVYVQGEQAPPQLVAAIETFNRRAAPPEVLVITRGGGSLDDLAAFNDERVVRAVAASRTPTVVAIGHEIDVSLAELAADMRASTPSNAASLLVPDKKHELLLAKQNKNDLSRRLAAIHEQLTNQVRDQLTKIEDSIKRLLDDEKAKLDSLKRLSQLLDPKAALRRGYAILTSSGRFVSSVNQVRAGERLVAELSDGKIRSVVSVISPNAKASKKP